MQLYCINLHEWKEDILASRPPELIGQDEGKTHFNDLVIRAYHQKLSEIKEALEKYKRVYLIVIENHNYVALFRSISSKQLEKILESNRTGMAQNREICKAMAYYSQNREENSKTELLKILADESTVPPGIIISIAPVLLQREGIGIAEAGK